MHLSGKYWGSLLLSVAALGLTGCGVESTTTIPAPTKAGQGNTVGGDHSGWWCVEHGIPEEECGMCNAKLSAEFRAKGDWCEEHTRPDSQCFHCHPENAARYAALYEQKYGEKPPAPTD
jgi:hypothetical protein